MLLHEVTPEEEQEQLDGMKRLGITPPLCWGDESRCPRPAVFVFNFACEGVWCATHFNELLRTIQ